MKRFLPLLCLLLSLTLLWVGLSLGCSELRAERSGGCTLYLPPVSESRKTPGVILCGGDRALAVELCRRGYGVVRCAPGRAQEAYDLLSACDEIKLNDVGLIAKGSKAAEELLALDYTLSETENYPWCLILWGCELSDTEGLANVLTLCGSEEGEQEGYFAEGSARMRASSSSRSADTLAIIEWLGSTLGHPRDGILEDGDSVTPYARLCYVLSAASALSGIYIYLRQKRKETI